VTAHGARRFRPDYAAVDDVDTAVVILEHASGCLTTIDNSRQASYGYDQRVEVHGSLGMAASENPYVRTSLVRTGAGTALPPMPSFFLDRYVPANVAQWEAFVRALWHGDDVPGIADARAPLVIGLAADRSRRERRPVDVAEIEATAAA
jgi:myo-inositol 2-dehydrogenase/D-chiro-inositol 1-dehydrogenase